MLEAGHIEALAIVTVALILLGTVATVLYQLAFGARARLRRRIVQVVGARGGRGGKGVSGAAPAARRKSVQNRLKEIETRERRKASVGLRQLLVQAGSAMSVRQYWIMSLVSGVVVAGLYAFFKMPPIGLIPAAITGLLGLPRLVLGIAIKRRLKTFTLQFADAIDVIVRGIRSGLPVGECIAIIGREMPEPVGLEFRMIAEGQRLGLTLDEVMTKACERVPTSELRFFAIVMGIQQQTGGNLAETLAKLSDVLRQRKKMRDKVQAMSSEAKSSAGIIGSLPIIVGAMLGVIAPQYIGQLFTTDTGHMLLAVSLAVMGLGVLVMRQMINFDM